MRPALTEGPYFVDTQLNRSDPSTGLVKPGVPLVLRFVSSGGCTLLPGATVDIWQCDAQGIYSGVQYRFVDTRGRSGCTATRSPMPRG